MPMANKQNLKPYSRPDDDGQPLADKPMQVRLPVDVDEWLRQLPDRAVWLRRVIVAAAREEMGE